MAGRASGVFRAALWKRTMEPGCIFEVTRLVISAAERSFQSRLSLGVRKESPWAAKGSAVYSGTRALAAFLFDTV